ncbi:MAG: DUF3299 domain-containing protein [Pseudomonadota bacterium]
MDVVDRSDMNMFSIGLRLLLKRVWVALALCLCSGVYAQTAQPKEINWDDLLPNLGVTDPNSHSPAAPETRSFSALGQPNHALRLANPFDPFDDGQMVVETWEPEAYDVAASTIDNEVVIDGYVLPLVWDKKRVVEFLLVPWVGACIHTPAPPPNQIIHVSYPAGLLLEKQFEAIRLSGTLRHERLHHDLFLVDGRRMIAASYTLKDARTAGEPQKVIASVAGSLPILARLQIWVNSLFTQSMVAVGEKGASKAVWFALLLSFGYGVFHTLGPGHGKSVVVSYFVGAGGSLRQGLTMGIRIAVFHVLSAVVFVFLFDFAVRQATGAPPSDYRTIRLGSYALIVAIGSVMLWHAVTAVIASRRDRATLVGSSGQDHAHAFGVHHKHSGCSACAAAEAPKGSGWIAASVGVVPCTGALLIMLFGLANDLIWPAVLMVVFISVGMAIAMSAIGVAALWGRNLAQKRFATFQYSSISFENGARLMGSACVLAIGVMLLITALAYPVPLEVQMDDIANSRGFGLSSEG